LQQKGFQVTVDAQLVGISVPDYGNPVAGKDGWLGEQVEGQ
jgi:hypothetical protein